MAIALSIRFFEKQFSNKAMVIFSTNKKNTEKCGKKVQKDDDGEKMFAETYMFKKVFAEDNFSSSPHPLPTTFQKNNGPSLMGTSYLDVLL